MNNYPIWWDKTITIFNRYDDPTTRQVSWYKTTVSNVFIKNVGDKIVVDNAILETDNTICRIPENAKFLEKYQWIELDDKSTSFTLGVGDLIVFGEVSDEINEYVSGSRSTDIINKYKKLQGCIVIKQLALNVGVGRVNPHYYIKGE